MKKILLLLCAIVAMSANIIAQDCSELFISTYVEGYGNNRAVEIYNPTDQPIDVSQYTVGRFSNGGTNYTGVALPANLIEPYDVFVVVLDKRDQNGTGLETPVWNGFQLYDTLIDELTGMPVLDNDGNVVFSVQYDVNGAPIIGNDYNDFLDLDGKGDAYVCPVYNVNNAMYFNGNDAVALVKGATLLPDGSNLIDVVGVIGEDPGDSWVNWFGAWMTRDKTLVRRGEIKKGSGIVAVTTPQSDTLAYNNWKRFPKNTFDVLQYHDCECDPNYTSVKEINSIPFSLYPNPSNGEVITITSTQRIESVEVVNILGQNLLRQTYSKNNLSEQLTIAQLPKGIHIVKVNFGDNKHSLRKLIIE